MHDEDLFQTSVFLIGFSVKMVHQKLGYPRGKMSHS